MKTWGYMLVWIAITCACQSNQDGDFRLFFNRLQKQVNDQPLMRAFLEGSLAFDSALVVCQPAAVHKLSAQVKDHLESLAGFSKARLSAELHLHFQRAEDFLLLVSKHLEMDQIHRTNPAFYDPRPRLIFLKDDGSMSEWIVALKALSINYEKATEMLQSVSEEQTTLAIQQGIAVYEMLSKEVKQTSTSLAANPTEKEAFEVQIERAQLACKSFIGFANSLGFENRDKKEVQD